MKNRAAKKKRLRVYTVIQDIHITVQAELKELVGKAADELGIPMSEYIVRVLAEHFGRPDLAVVPRKRPGRPRKAISA